MQFTIQLFNNDKQGSEAIEQIIRQDKSCNNDCIIDITLLESKQIVKMLKNRVVLQQAVALSQITERNGCMERQY